MGQCAESEQDELNATGIGFRQVWDKIAHARLGIFCCTSMESHSCLAKDYCPQLF